MNKQTDKKILQKDFPLGVLEYYMNENNEAVLLDYKGNAKTLFLPVEIDGIPVATEIPDEAFSGCEELETLFVSDVSFGFFVFANCKNLTKIYYTDNIEYKEFSFTDKNHLPRTILTEYDGRT